MTVRPSGCSVRMSNSAIPPGRAIDTIATPMPSAKTTPWAWLTPLNVLSSRPVFLSQTLTSLTAAAVVQTVLPVFGTPISYWAAIVP